MHRGRIIVRVLFAGCTTLIPVLFYNVFREPLSQLSYRPIVRDPMLLTRNEVSKTVLQEERETTHHTLEQPNNVDIYYSIKTTERYYEERLMLQMMTWFETVENKVH